MERSWKKLVGLKAKTYSYLIDDNEDEKGAEKCVIKKT